MNWLKFAKNSSQNQSEVRKNRSMKSGAFKDLVLGSQRNLILMSFVLSSCTGIFNTPRSQDAGIESAQVKGEIHSSAQVEIEYRNMPENIMAHCILENIRQVEKCRWVTGNLPKTYVSEFGDGEKTLTIWTRGKNNVILGPITTPSFIIDTTAPNWSSAGLSHASTYASLSLSPTISFNDNATDNLTDVSYEYAIGTGNGVSNRANIKAWTAWDEGSPFQVSGLSLSDGQTYYLSMRAIDGVNNVSSVFTSTGWTVTMGSDDPTFVGISPASPSNDSTPVITGTLDAEAATVEFFSDSSCTVSLGSGTKAQFEGAGVTLSMPLNPVSATPIYAKSLTASATASDCTLLTSYRHDNTAPTVVRAYSNIAAGTYGPGSAIDVRIEFSENITVSGTPTLILETGASDALINMTGTSGTNTLVFTYTVASGDVSTDLNYQITSAMTAGSYIRDAVGNDADLTLPGLASAESLAGQEAIVVDGIAPVAPSIVLDSPASSPGNDSTPTFEIELTGGSNFLSSDVITLHEGADCSAAAVATLTSETGTSALITRGSAMNEGSTNYRVKVTDAVGNATCSTSHATAGFRLASYTYDNTPAGAFTLVSAVADDGEVVLSWNSSTGAASYIVKYGTSSGSYPTTFTTNGTSPTTITGLTNDTTYYFMVTAVKVGGNTDATAELSAVPSFCVDYPAVTSHTDIGAGTSASPYLICRPQQLASLGATSADWSKHYKVMTHIDLTGYTQVADGTQWIPIGNSTTRFTGTFDGNNKNISNLTYSDTNRDYLGLFGYTLGPKATIKNVKMRNVSLVGRDYVGGLIGLSEVTTVLNSSTTGSISGGRTGLGGLIGYASNNNTIGTSWSSVNVTATVAGVRVGGLLGHAGYGTQVYNSFASGNVVGNLSWWGLGGFVGYVVDARIYNSYSKGNVNSTVSENSGGFCGYCRGTFTGNFSLASTVSGRQNGGSNIGPFGGNFVFATNSNNFYSSNVTVTNSGTGGATNTNGATSVDTVATPNYFHLTTNAPLTTWDFTNSWATQVGTEPIPNPSFLDEGTWGSCATHLADSPFAGGVGTMENPYLICTAAQLNNIGSGAANMSHKVYKLMADLDLSGYTFATFNMIGSAASPFKGIFNGNGKVISNLTLNAGTGDRVALVSYMDTGSIFHLGLSNFTITGDDYIAALVGHVYRASVHTVFVDQATITGDYGLGGLIGYSQGRIQNCYVVNSSVLAVAGASQMGGITGYVDDSGMGNCFGVVDVSKGAATGHSTGPLAGSASGGLAASNYRYSSSVCNNCGHSEGTAVADFTDFYFSANAPLSSWDFATTWQEVPTDYPTFR